MAHATPGFTPGPGAELTQRTLPVFFGTLELLLGSGVTTVAEAAFQDHVWRPRLEPLRRLQHCSRNRCSSVATRVPSRHFSSRLQEPFLIPGTPTAAMARRSRTAGP